ncbi:spore coat protein GerQ [Paenibacillus larvae]|nr:spore coat protein GerQ [Paenibacillus larvae]MDT2261477.1 spore coat protein GerQ [Paenibacillus larvae]
MSLGLINFIKLLKDKEESVAWLTKEARLTGIINKVIKGPPPQGYPTYPPGFTGYGQPGAAAQQTPLAPAGMGVPSQVSAGMGVTPQGIVPQLPMEESFIENILRLNLGKVATIYMTFENNSEWNAKVFQGVLEAAGRDHIIISDPKTGMRYLLLMVNLDYITFTEPLNYYYPGYKTRK